MRCIFLIVVMVSLSLAVRARAEQPQANANAARNNLAMQGIVEGLTIPQIPNAPFRGQLQVELTRPLTGGATLRAHFYNIVARDTLGRVHQERRSIVPLGSNEESTLNLITLFDTPRRARYSCDVPTRICKITNFRPLVQIVDEPEGESHDGKSYLTREKKGIEVLNNESVERTLETRTIYAGAEGNDRPMISTREFWYQPELEVNVAVRRVCACGTTQDLKLGDLQRGEPDPALFVPPAGYTLIDLRPGAHPER